MKILVVSNIYPPQHVGGYEIGCRDVVEKLRGRGHNVHVLTSNFQNGKTANPPNEINVERILHFKGLDTDPLPDRNQECAKLTRSIKTFSPDVVYFWNQAGLSLWLPLAAHWQGCHLAFFLSDTNYVWWRVGAWLLNTARKNSVIRTMLGRHFLVHGWPVVENRTCHFCSDFIQQEAVKNRIAFAPKNSIVAHWGIEPAQFSITQRERWPVKKLLYVGQLIPQKGIHTAIAAFALVAKEKGFSDLTFSLAGGGMNPEYEKKIRAMPVELGLGERVKFLGKIQRADLSQIYAEHDALIFPSEWDEPFAITPLEAIASGLAVIGTTTGGSGELFRNHETAMTYQAGNVADAARAIRELCADRELFEKICRQAQREVREKHTLDAMVDKIEASLLRVADGE